MLPTALLLAVVAVPRIDHQPVDCVVKDHFPQIDAVLDPTDDTAKLRVYFKSAKDPDYYYEDLVLLQGRYFGRLPKPKADAGPVTYYLEAVTSDGKLLRTLEITSQVVRRASECAEGGKVAVDGKGGDVEIVSTTTSRQKPDGFKGVRSVTPQAQEAEAATAADQPPQRPVAASPQRSAEAPAASRAPSPTIPAAFANPSEGDYQIGAQDILKIAVFGHDDLTQTVIVQDDGTFFFNLVGRVKGSDMTPKELERKLTTLLAQGYLRNPQVSVMVQEYRSKSVFVMGEVSRPGPIPYSGNMTVMQMLAQVGPTAGAGSEVMILRPRPGVQAGPLSIADAQGAEAAGNPQADMLRVNIRDIQMGQLDKNILLRPNDTVFVMQAAKVYLLGEVRNPGPQVYQSGLTVRQAIVNAGGFTPDASKGKIIVGRQVNGEYKEFKVKPEDTVQPGDTITVKAKLF
jgi:polysaccharide biosynthesis/export protein